MQTPTTTTFVASGAPVMTWSSRPGTPTHSNTTGCLGVVRPASSARSQIRVHGISGIARSFSMLETPSSKRSVAFSMWPVRRVLSASHGDRCAGSTTMSAPIAVASARRPGDRSLAMIVRTPVALSMPMTASPTGPHPTTTAT